MGAKWLKVFCYGSVDMKNAISYQLHCTISVKKQRNVDMSRIKSEQ